MLSPEKNTFYNEKTLCVVRSDFLWCEHTLPGERFLLRYELTLNGERRIQEARENFKWRELNSRGEK